MLQSKVVGATFRPRPEDQIFFQKKNSTDKASWCSDYIDTEDKDEKTLYTIGYVITQSFTKSGKA